MRTNITPPIFALICGVFLIVIGNATYSQESLRPPQSLHSYPKAAAAIIVKTNEIRNTVGLQPVREVTYLTNAARIHSQEMARLDYFSHTSPTPGREKPRDRVQLSGGRDPKIGENIYRASGLSSGELASRAMAAWERSPSHYKNIVDPDFNAVGIGILADGDEFVVTQVFSQQTSTFKP